jgi:hypothetical protein
VSRRESYARLALSVGAPLLLLGALAWPLVFTDATFNQDWLNHLWYVWHQTVALRANHLPSLFLEYAHGVFYPLFAFYGGTIYALTGMLSLALGDAPLDAYVLTYLLGFVAAYVGWYWMARSFGLGRWLAHSPGVVFVTSASYLMIVYGLGDWPEFLAVSAMPLMIASGLAVVREDRLRPLTAVALAASSIVFFGSHLLTVIWGSTVLAIVGVAILACVPEARRRVGWRNALRILGIVVPALLVSAWFLLPTAAYESRTVIAQSYPIFRRVLRQRMYTVAAHNLFTLSRARASGTIVTTALPVLAIAWVLAGVCLSLRARRGGTWMRLLLLISVATALLTVVMTHAGLILALPRLYATLQFSLRLESYVLLGIAGAVLAVLVLNRNGGRDGRVLTWALAPVLAVSIVGAAQQAAAHPSGRSRSLALSSYLQPTYEQEGLLDYVDDSLKVIKARLPVIRFPPGSVRHDRASIVVREAPGQRVDTNIRSTPELVHLSGARIVGADREANDVLEIDSGSGGSAGLGAGRGRVVSERISVSAAASPPVVAGRVLSAIGLGTLALELTLLVVPRPAVGRARRKLGSLASTRRQERAR